MTTEKRIQEKKYRRLKLYLQTTILERIEKAGSKYKESITKMQTYLTPPSDIAVTDEVINGIEYIQKLLAEIEKVNKTRTYEDLMALELQWDYDIPEV